MEPTEEEVQAKLEMIQRGRNETPEDTIFLKELDATYKLGYGAYNDRFAPQYRSKSRIQILAAELNRLLNQ